MPVPLLHEHRGRRELLSASVRRRLLEAILDGTLVAGERLHDDQLIGWLGVSRTPIRSALERLAELGLIEMEPNRFTRVATPSAACQVQALEVYALLVASAVAGLVARLTEAEIAEFRRRLGAVTAVEGRGEEAMWGRADLESVDRAVGYLARRNGNRLLHELLQAVRVRLVFSFVTHPVPILPGSVSAFTGDLLAAVERRDETAVARALVEHLGSRAIGDRLPGVGGDG